MTKLVYIASVAALAAVAVSASAQTLLAHGLHTSCMYGSMTPTGQGDPSGYHRTPEAGVHISCRPPEGPGPKDPKVKQEQRKREGNTKSLQQ
jgi:hypothetical protein